MTRNTFDRLVPPLNTTRAPCALACPTAEQDTWLPATYAGTRIDTRHVSLDGQLIRDVIGGTKLSGSVYLPTGAADDRGPTTGQRLEHYSRLAPPLAIAAARAITSTAV